ncbi:MAG: 4-(cytidine 5'-diphospho)-2-C-methyl-D-erythritol kinase [Chitinispirillales bacterium]|jgi:4-diphosphocytidyl-2-C-methyl-D-erythritol kinase|nr:4-(cytidine 5'-diphospho)-2-C-methyl-D-erythritol kinase [Chitinispirillales bacterium]
MTTIDSPTRVTLSLDIIRRLTDGPYAGYHELGIVKHRIALADTLSVEPLDDGTQADIVECDDPRVPRDGGNICVKACRLVRERFGRSGFFRISIDKRIPVMGGLAGGSANAAAMLRALDSIWELRLTAGQFRDTGRELGMDVPYFFDGGTAFDSEAAGALKPIDTAIRLYLVLAIPEFGVSTKEAYGSIDYGRVAQNVSLTDGMIEALSRNDFDGVAGAAHNDFELTVFERYPRLREIRDGLKAAGCAAACMSGSGSTIVGLAADRRGAERIAGKVDCETIVTETLPSPIEPPVRRV